MAFAMPIQRTKKMEQKLPKFQDPMFPGMEERKSRVLFAALTRMIQHVAIAEGAYLLQLPTFQNKRSGPWKLWL
jgi:hypothetical protein